MYFCPIGCRDEHFRSAPELRDHISSHLPSASAEQTRAIMLLGQKAAPDNTISVCPLCKYTLTGFDGHIKHIGRHLEQLALFALPDLDDGLEDAEIDEDEVSLASEASSGDGQGSADVETTGLAVAPTGSPPAYQFTLSEHEPKKVSNSFPNDSSNIGEIIPVAQDTDDEPMDMVTQPTTKVEGGSDRPSGSNERAELGSLEEEIETAARENKGGRHGDTSEETSKSKESVQTPSENIPGIGFRDAMGRKFPFPFHLVNTWEVRNRHLVIS